MKSSKPVPEKVKKVTARRKSPAKEVVVDEVFPELMIVGTNIAKNKSYYLAQKALIQRVAHGVYIPTDRMADGKAILIRHAIRLASLHFKNATGLCYSSAFTLEAIIPESGPPLVFVAGEYSYGLELGEGDIKLMLVQSLHPPYEMLKTNDEYEFYEDKICSDPIGEFVVKVPRPELLVLHNFERVKEWSEKKIASGHLKKFVAWIVDARYGGSIPAFSANFAELAIKCNRLEEHDHAVTALLAEGYPMSERYLRKIV
ncbi:MULTISPECIES: hypothetical protein [Undibacterium]|uniref:Transcriptional regulator n=1 Tax=Undibacterium umbellatum TaxID=2762300 RepID=A0ABR6ZHD7_9BURK|nr:MULTISPECIES: hypothetical protein [Undibacterium]MBC3910771.1 hypothetical protein [Undibacterium umbellatum]MDP1977836.1 hypothetical protein [Undibacterium sp.]